MPRKSTLKDVADAVGVSPSTVSKVLSGTARVSVETRLRIEQAIEDLHYIPNVVARGLVQGQTYCIGVVTQAISSPFYGAAMLGVQEALDDTEYAPLYMDGRWMPRREEQALGRMMGRVDGIIVLGGRLDDDRVAHYARRVPLICVGRKIEGLEHQSLMVDNDAGARLAVEHLLELGHRKIAHIAGSPQQPDAEARKQTYLNLLQAEGIEVKPSWIVHGDFREQSGTLAMLQLLESGERFSAVFCANDQMAYGAMLALYRAGLRVPEDVSLIGFDDAYTSSFVLPPLTTVHQPMEEAGRAAAQGMLDLLEGKDINLGHLKPRLIVRESVRAHW
ncbi:LacI family DNA-binding transcriptional regulator [Deinococcus cellulosilyticus]|uniref:LacI family transcriptional regulator n=1 Tax=Deinococcus cellulosilyticus (strain DSM 18568 / NBRC 106333 / KACC 11606 / 5516J-15) TaxID=1223518 RepID=A0A511N631_DEIC1|nr:LacI family DNA-binding transcriptional regulator [Deinococcus cellulosilyticus]GEM48320.1 LacI family transcriptional regulator [Deinococcus cellulosilyticus NBRC 106333 = KACC 11606]